MDLKPFNSHKVSLRAINVLLVSPSFFPATYWGGPIASTLGLCDSLTEAGLVNLRVLTTDSAGPSVSQRLSVADFPEIVSAGYPVYYCKRRFGYSGSPRLIAELFRMIRWADVVHLNAVYSTPTIPTLLLARLFSRPVVWSPRGAFQRWPGSKRNISKFIWDGLCNLIANKERLVLHVTSPAEDTASRHRIPHAKTVVVPNAVTVPARSETRSWFAGGIFHLLFLGRLDPIKGLENLLEAIACPENFDVKLVICGDGDTEYVATIKRLVLSLGVASRVEFRGHIEASEKAKAFDSADVCVVPSFTENFGMVVAESLAHGVPVIVSKGAPWAAVESQGCGLWVENTPSELSIALRTIRTKDLGEMGKLGRAWMARDFGWSKVAAEMQAIYRELGEVQVDEIN